MPKTERVRFVAADVGGTHARVALVCGASGAGIEILEYAEYTCSAHAGLDDILRTFLQAHGADVRATDAVVACAGYLQDGTVLNVNLPWGVREAEILDRLGLRSLSLINDFEATAHAVLRLDEHDTIALTECTRGQAGGPVVVVGPGTGLGSAVFVPGRLDPGVIAAEAGQINFAPVGTLERRVLEELMSRDGYVSCERILSGPGLLELYRALCVIHDATPVFTEPGQISAAAMHDRDLLAHLTLETFCAALGGFAGNLAMLYGASGGVYLAGGIPSRIVPFLRTSRFLERFLDKGRMRAFLETVPVRILEHGQLGVIGAAGWYLDRQPPDDGHR